MTIRFPLCSELYEPAAQLRSAKAGSSEAGPSMHGQPTSEGTDQVLHQKKDNWCGFAVSQSAGVIQVSGITCFAKDFLFLACICCLV